MSKVARISSGKITFIPEGGGEIVLAHQQNVTLNRSAEKKELLSNDNSIGESVQELETKVTYTLKSEIKDLSLDILSIAFKGAVTQKTYKAGDVFVTGRTIKAKTVALAIGDLVMDGDKIYVVLEAMTASAFDVAKCANNPYKATVTTLSPENRGANYGKIVVDGVNVATGNRQILVIPKINLSFDGDIAISGDDWANISLEGKVLRKENEPLYLFTDA